MESAELHEKNLDKICRICGEPLTEIVRRKPISKHAMEKEPISISLKAAVGIDVDHDIPGVHPQYVCHGCDRKLRTWKKKHTKKTGTKPMLQTLTVHAFTPHDDDCEICHRLSEQAAADRPTEQATDLQLAAELKSKEHGFATWIGDNRQHIFVTLDQGLCASRAIMIFPDASWRLQVLDREVRPDTLPTHIEDANLDELFDWASRPFCTGSPDFASELAKTVFTDRSGESVVAKVESKFTIIRDHVAIKETVRSIHCHGITSAKASRCPPCAKYRSDLYAKRNEKTKAKPQEGDPSSHARHDLMDKETLAKKAENLKKENDQLKKQIEQLKSHINGLMENHAVPLDPKHNAELTDLFKQNTSHMESILTKDSPQRLLWEQQKQYLETKDPRQMRWHPTIIKWCIALYEKSPIAYKTIRKSNFIKLPHHTTLFKYTHFTEARSGINNDILKEIAKEANLDASPDSERNMSLLFDEMKVKNNLVYSQRSGRIWGFTEMGDINEEVTRFERQVMNEEDPPLASYVLVVMIRGIFSSLKKAVAWYPCTGFTGTQLFHSIWEVVEKVEYAGFYVRAFVSDGASTNRKFYSLHGTSSSEMPAYCAPNPVDPTRNVYFFCDVPHLMKTTRNCWENSGWNSKSRNLMFRGKQISWLHLVNLFEWDQNIGRESPGLRLLPRLTPDHIHLTPSLRMRVYLATQVLSSSVAHALTLQGKVETESTIHFINYMDTFFDIMNISNRFDGSRKHKGALVPFTSMDDPRFKWLTNDFLGFLDEWQKEGDSVVPKLKADEKRRLCLSPQTLEGLRITVYSLVELAPILLAPGPPEVSYILTEKFSQDPLEEYFSKHRGRGGFNDNPSTFIFGHQFNSLFVSASASVRYLYLYLGLQQNGRSASR